MMLLPRASLEREILDAIAALQGGDGIPVVNPMAMISLLGEPLGPVHRDLVSIILESLYGRGLLGRIPSPTGMEPTYLSIKEAIRAHRDHGVFVEVRGSPTPKIRLNRLN